NQRLIYLWMGTSYSRHDMEELGIRNLREFLSFVPGILATNTGIGNTPINSRGLYETFNQKILFLIDDAPYWAAVNAEIPYAAVPWDAIEKIEVIRGPGTLLYGSNATAGVIKIITRKSSGNDVRVPTGSDGLKQAASYYQHRFPGQQHTLSFSMEARREDGYKAQFSDNDGSTEISTQALRQEESTAFVMNYQYQGLTLLLQGFDAKKTGNIRLQPLIQGNAITNTGFILHGQYQWPINDGMFKLYGDYNNFHISFATDNNFNGKDTIGKPIDDQQDYRARVGASFEQPLADAINLYMGLESEQRSTGGIKDVDRATGEVYSESLPATDLYEYSAFIQLEVKTESSAYTLGGRYTENEVYGSAFSPRASAVFLLNGTQSIKLLYSTAFSSPTILQTHIQSSPGSVGNPNLVPEQVESIELAYSLIRHNSLFVINAYYMEGEDFIERSGNSFINGEKIDTSGLELDYQYKHRALKLFANANYIFKQDPLQEQDKFTLIVPDYTLNLGVAYTLTDRHRLGASMMHANGMHYRVGQRSELSSFTLLNANYRFSWHDWKMDFTVNNLLDDEMLLPDLGIGSPSNEVTIQGAVGRIYSVSVLFNY
ncbi:MAG: TonB-dependent receptor, partial [Pseudomonadales bacterium]|nr:TonB-dependent receptor [Pseudomonadales bacterium]